MSSGEPTDLRTLGLGEWCKPLGARKWHVEVPETKRTLCGNRRVDDATVRTGPFVHPLELRPLSRYTDDLCVGCTRKLRKMIEKKGGRS